MTEPAYITEELALECYDAMRAHLMRNRLDPDETTLYLPGHEGEFWALSIEGTGLATDNELFHDVAWPPGVNVSPRNGWIFALRPDTPTYAPPLIVQGPTARD